MTVVEAERRPNRVHADQSNHADRNNRVDQSNRVDANSRVRDDRDVGGRERSLTPRPRPGVQHQVGAWPLHRGPLHAGPLRVAGWRARASRSRARVERLRMASGARVPCGRARNGGEKWMLLVAGCFTCFFILLVGFVGVASVVPETPAGAMVVQGRPGDTVPELAREFAPHRDAREVMQRIVALNGLDHDGPVPAGPLVVPTDHT